LLTHHLKEEEEELLRRGGKFLVTQGRKSLQICICRKSKRALKEDFLVKETPMEAELQND